MRLEVPQSPEDRAQRIPLAAAFPAGLRQLVGRHVLGDERRVVEAVLGMQPPAAVPKQAALGLQAVVQRRAGIRHQDVVRGKAESVTHGKVARLPDRLERIMVVAQRERGPRLQMMIAENLDGLLVSVPAGPQQLGMTGAKKAGCLLHLLQVSGIERLEADHVAHAAAFGQQRHQLRVAGHVDRSLRHPADSHGNQLAQKRFGRFVIRKEIVIDKEDEPTALAFDLRQDLATRPHEIGPLKEHADGAKIATEPAAAPELHQRDGQIAFACEQVAPRLDTAHLRDARRGAIHLAKRSTASVLDHLVPERFGVAQINRIGVLQALLRQQRGMESAQDHRHAAQPVLGGDLVGPASRVDLDGDGHQVGRLVVRYRLDPVVHQRTFDLGRRQTRQDAQLQRLHAAFVDVQTVLQPSDVRLDEGDLHDADAAVFFDASRSHTTSAAASEKKKMTLPMLCDGAMPNSSTSTAENTSR